MRGARASKQRLEEVAELPIAGVAEIEPGMSCARTELVASTKTASPRLIVGGTLLGFLQRLESFIDVLEALLGILFLADIRMKLARQLAIGRLDLVG